MVIKKENRLFLLELLQKRLNENKIDLRGLGADTPGNSFRSFRPYCDCWGTLSPEEETWNWHTHHVNKCLKNVLQAVDFLERWGSLVVEEGKKLKQEKKKVIENIEQKVQQINYKSKIGLNYVFKNKIMDCLNKRDLEIEEKNQITYLENFANTWQKNSEAEKEKWKKQEEERIKQEREKAQAEEIKKKVQEEKLKQKEQEFKNQVEEEKKETNPKSDKELNDLKTKFYEVYQEGKKYNQTELTRLLHMLEKIKKEIDLDSDLQDAKTELQTIQSKSAPYWTQVYPIISRGENVKEKLEGLDKRQLEDCRKALEELKEIIYLSLSDEHLLEEINNKLKALNLEEEINQLKNNKTENPQQQEESQKKISEKEQELEQIKKQSKSEENKQFQISPEILSNFSSLSNFNSKEKIEALINPVKDNPEFLLEIQTKHQIEDLNALFSNKSSEEIITIIKRFEYDNLSPSDKENKDKKIKAYYQQLNELAENGKLTEEQIGKYLCKEATGEITNSQTNGGEQNKWRRNDNGTIEMKSFLLITISVGLLLIMLWVLKKYKQGWYKLTSKEVRKNWWKFWQWSDKYIKKTLKKRWFSNKINYFFSKGRCSFISKTARKKLKKFNVKPWME